MNSGYSSLLRMRTYITCNEPPCPASARARTALFLSPTTSILGQIDISDPVGYTSRKMEVCNTIFDPVFCVRSNFGLSADF